MTVSADTFPDLDYIDVVNNSTDPEEGEMLHFCGFPSDHSTVVERRISGAREDVGIALFPTVFSGKVLHTPSDDDIKFKFGGLDPREHCLVPYEISPMSQHPRGFSGAAAWWESGEKLRVWRPNFRFAGIVTHSHREGKVVRVFRAPAIFRFLESLFGKPRLAAISNECKL